MSNVKNAAGPFCRRLYLHENRIEDACRTALSAVDLMRHRRAPFGSNASSSYISALRKNSSPYPPHPVAVFSDEFLAVVDEDETVVSGAETRAAFEHRSGFFGQQ